ncbi:MAG: polymerase sigma-70 factor, subfamily [Actinomycetota bacterium]|jgi:RNA polymerase sigma-70 factor (ECF subfamily)
MSSKNFDSVDDAVLVAAIGQGDARAMEEAVRVYRGAVFAFARRLAGDDARADEIAQDVFLRLWQRWDRFDASRGTLRAFLFAMTHGRSIDLIRSDTARVRREIADARLAPDRTSDPATQAVASDVNRLVRSALEVLSPAERQLVQLAYFDGNSYRAVAELLGQPEGTVKSRIRKALSKLRQAMATEQYGDYATP